MRTAALVALAASAAAAQSLRGPSDAVDLAIVRKKVLATKAFADKVAGMCKGAGALCRSSAEQELFCQVLERSKPALAAAHCGQGGQAKPAANATAKKPAAAKAAAAVARPRANASLRAKAPPAAVGTFAVAKARIVASSGFNRTAQRLARALGCSGVKKAGDCASYVREVSFCLAFADKMSKFSGMAGVHEEIASCKKIDTKVPQLAMLLQRQRQPMFVQEAWSLQRRSERARPLGRVPRPELPAPRARQALGPASSKPLQCPPGCLHRV